MLQALQVVALVFVALAMSFAVAHAAELPGKLRLDKRDYLAVQPIYHPGFTIGGISEPLSILLLAALAVLMPRATPAFWLVVAGTCLLLLMQAVYWLAVHPVNRFWLEQEQLPKASAGFFALGNRKGRQSHGETDWKRLRNRWEYAHAVRAALAFAALTLVSIAVVIGAA